MKRQRAYRQYSPWIESLCVLLSICLFTSSCGTPKVEDKSLETTQIDNFQLTRVKDFTQVKDSDVLTFVCENVSTKPDVATPNCADFGEAVFEITWKQWSVTGAQGEGTYSLNDCNPDCAGGTRSSIPVNVSLNDLYTDGSRYFLRNFSFVAKDENIKLQVSGVWDLADFYINVPEMRADS